MKIRKLFQRAAAFALAAVTALSAVPATTAFAAGDIGTISFTPTTAQGTQSDIIPVRTSAVIPQEVRANISTVCMWTGKRRSAFSRAYP